MKLKLFTIALLHTLLNVALFAAETNTTASPIQFSVTVLNHSSHAVVGTVVSPLDSFCGIPGECRVISRACAYLYGVGCNGGTVISSGHQQSMSVPQGQTLGFYRLDPRAACANVRAVVSTGTQLAVAVQLAANCPHAAVVQAGQATYGSACYFPGCRINQPLANGQTIIIRDGSIDGQIVCEIGQITQAIADDTATAE